jgi:Tol biopolymer transport system component
VNDRWRLISSIYHAALARTGVDRAAFLVEACAGDDAVRREVDSLLMQHASGGFLAAPAVVRAAAMVSDAGEASPLTGRRFGAYELQERLGAGGMGEVYRARDTRLGRDVAVKILPHAFESDPERLARFEREARVLATLNHPNIGAIYGLEISDGVQALILELVDGETLSNRIARGPLPVKEAIAIARQIAIALDAAHQKGIVHRDLKPSNVALTRGGEVKVLDFGLAKSGAADASAPDSRLPTITIGGTVDGLVLGTAAYMSPEQARGEPVDKRTDVWAFGCVLYELLTARLAFPGKTVADTMAAVLERTPDWSALPASTPLKLRRLIERCLEKDPARRLHDIGAARERFLGGDLQRSTGSQATVSLARGWPIAALLIVSLIAAAVVWRTQSSAGRSQPLRAETLTTFPGQELYPSLAPDGERVAFSWTGPKQDNADIYVQQIGAGAPLRLTTDTRIDFNPVWSPDGRWIAFLRGVPASPLSRSDRDLILIPPLGGSERTLVRVRVQEITLNTAYLAWCPDSSCLVVSDATGENTPDALFAIPIGGGDRRQLTNPTAPVLADTNPSFSPDGQSLLFLRRATWGFGELTILPLRSDLTSRGETRTLPAGNLKPDSAAWAADGKQIVFSAGAIGGGAALWSIDARGAEPARLPFVGEDGILPVIWSRSPGPATRLVYVRSFTDENIWRIDVPDRSRVAAAPTVAISSTKADIHPQLSPDGRRVAFTSTRTGHWEIWVSDLDGSNAMQLTTLNAPTGTGAPHWSPDGRLLVFASDAEGQFDIFVVPSGGGQSRNLTSHPAFDHVPAFSRDGQWIYFSSTRSGRYEVWKLPVSGGVPRQVTSVGGWLSQESTDGRDLYFTSPPAGTVSSSLWRMPVSGGTAVKFIDGIIGFSFAVSDRGIYYVDQPAAESRLQFYDLMSQSSALVARNLGDPSQFGGFTASRDGRTVLYARRDTSIDDLMLVNAFH